MEKLVRKDRVWEFQQEGFKYVEDPEGDRVKRGSSFLMRKEEPKLDIASDKVDKPKKKVKK